MKYLDCSLSITGPAYQGVPAGSLNFIEQGTKEIVSETAYGIFQALSGGGVYSTSSIYVIRGVNEVVSGGVYTIGTGSVLYNNEVYLVPGVSFTPNPTWSLQFYGTINTFNSPTLDPVLFSDGSLHNVNNDRTIIITLATASAGVTPTAPVGSLANINSFISFPSVPAQCSTAITTAVGQALIDTPILYSPSSWNNATIATGWGNPATSVTSYTIDGFGYVSLGGVIGNNTVSTPGLTLFQLPPIYRPSRVRRFSITYYNNNSGITNFQPGYIQIDTSGIVTLVPQVGVSVTGTGWYIYLDGIMFNTL